MPHYIIMMARPLTLNKAFYYNPKTKLVIIRRSFQPLDHEDIHIPSLPISMHHNNNQESILENELLTQSSSTQSTLHQQNSQVHSTIPLTGEEIQGESPATVSITPHYYPQASTGIPLHLGIQNLGMFLHPKQMMSTLLILLMNLVKSRPWQTLFQPLD